MKNDILKFLSICNKLKVSELKEELEWSIGKIQKIKTTLIDLNFINIKKTKIYLTKTGISELKKYKAKNIVIYAAGFGSRLKPITNSIPKPLIKIENQTLIESLISKIPSDINVFVITGYLNKKFDFLNRKYKNVSLVYNEKYNTENNISSFIKSLEKVNGNTMFFEGDVLWKKKRIFFYGAETWIYASKEKRKNEWTLKVNGRIANGYELNGNGPLWGNGYFISNEDILKIKKNKEEYNPNDYAESLIFKNNITMRIEYLKKDDKYEIDTLEDYRNIASEWPIKKLGNPMEAIMFAHSVEIYEITDFNIIKGGLTNDAYSYMIKNKKFVIRFPKQETNKNIDRINEMKILNNIKDLKISSNVFYADSKTGILITEFIENIDNNIDFNNKSIDIFSLHNKIHNSKIKVDNIFNPIALFNKYTKNKNIFEIEKYKNKFLLLANKYYSHETEKNFVLCHNDSIEGNIIKANNNYFLIDWELSSMNNRHWDLASFIIENNINKKNEMKLIEKYKFNNDVLKDIKFLLMFLWSAWCYQYKREKWEQKIINYYSKTLERLTNNEK
ncbi:MAG: sugar phosphate nucleotidyltransferase [Mycoplasma sp.]|nr:sugar phosphate nucleotidyltransferase [Mycoplasma sp.]